MGNDISLHSKPLSQQKINRNSFDFVQILGRGGFGKVWKATHKLTDENYAIKEMIKGRIIDTNNQQNVIDEREILSKLNHG